MQVTEKKEMQARQDNREVAVVSAIYDEVGRSMTRLLGLIVAPDRA